MSLSQEVAALAVERVEVALVDLRRHAVIDGGAPVVRLFQDRADLRALARCGSVGAMAPGGSMDGGGSAAGAGQHEGEYRRTGGGPGGGTAQDLRLSWELRFWLIAYVLR